MRITRTPLLALVLSLALAGPVAAQGSSPAAGEPGSGKWDPQAPKSRADCLNIHAGLLSLVDMIKRDMLTYTELQEICDNQGELLGRDSNPVEESKNCDILFGKLRQALENSRQDFRRGENKYNNHCKPGVGGMPETPRIPDFAMN